MKSYYLQKLLQQTMLDIPSVFIKMTNHSSTNDHLNLSHQSKFIITCIVSNILTFEGIMKIYYLQKLLQQTMLDIPSVFIKMTNHSSTNDHLNLSHQSKFIITCIVSNILKFEAIMKIYHLQTLLQQTRLEIPSDIIKMASSSCTNDRLN